MIDIFCIVDWHVIITILKIMVPSLTTMVAAIIVYKFTKRNMENETQERMSRFRNDKIYEAGMEFWSLLAYTTESENRHSILYWSKDKNTGQKQYYLHPGNAKEFITKLNEINYEKGHGLFLRNYGRELFYEYRNILYGFLLKEKDNREEKILVQKSEMAEKLLQLHQQMLLRLTEEMKLGSRAL
jgi:phosphate/sulfate permease